jgi:hypothetical protein
MISLEHEEGLGEHSNVNFTPRAASKDGHYIAFIPEVSPIAFAMDSAGRR